MHIHSLYTYNQLRNFTYAIELSDKSCIVLDPWDADQVDRFLEEHSLVLKTIINTHEHWDHTQGNEDLIARHGCEVWAHENGVGKIPGLTRTLKAHEELKLDENTSIRVMDTPGHTFAHLCFLVLQNNVPSAVFTGDTLFNAGVGNCHNGGDPDAMYETITEQFHTLPDNVLIYPGHEYLENNLRFTLNFEPSNENANLWLEKVAVADPGKNPLRTTIADERMFNTFFRLDNPEIQSSLNLQGSLPREVFLELRKCRNSW